MDNHTGILPDNKYNEIDNEDDDQEFLNIPEEDITYEIFEDDQIITELIDIFKNSYENTEDLDEIDDSDKIITISTNVALKSLETVNIFLLQQENTDEYIKLIGKIENFIRKKQVHMMQQTTID
ncbi:unnamed protein product [Rhizophagus irregularis]|nr:unnamed protein product [Rhizophagus irregularis]